jgi:hypothetical protein
MSAIDSLIRHPKTFLQSNAVWVSGMLNVQGRGQADEKLWPVTLRKVSNVTCLSLAGGAMPCWEIIPSTSMSDMALAYFLPWGPNSTKSIRLGAKANLFLTDSMNGCSFAGGTGANPLVAHVNYNQGQQEGNPIDQPYMDAQINQLFPGGAPKTFRKADYLTNTFPNVTLIGRRRHGNWKFCYQVRDYLGATATKNYQLISSHYVH